jgi:soluble lytic murein transglycosylase-like protein
MGTMTRSLSLIMLLAATPAKADEVARWRPMIEDASARFGIPTSWIERVMRAESRGHTMLDGRPIRSRAGAMGLMQLMPATWTEMRVRLGLGNNPDDPRDNILAGTLYLRTMYDRFGYPGLFGAYNAGPGAYASYLAGTRRLPGETIAYLEAVGGTKDLATSHKQSAPPPLLFVVRRLARADQPQVTENAQPASLFAVRKVQP